MSYSVHVQVHIVLLISFLTLEVEVTTYDLDPMSRHVLIPQLLGNVLFLLKSV